MGKLLTCSSSRLAAACTAACCRLAGLMCVSVWTVVLLLAWMSLSLSLSAAAVGPTLGPNVTPPPGNRGDVLLPRLALPVPFCL